MMELSNYQTFKLLLTHGGAHESQDKLYVWHKDADHQGGGDDGHRDHVEPNRRDVVRHQLRWADTLVRLNMDIKQYVTWRLQNCNNYVAGIPGTLF